MIRCPQCRHEIDEADFNVGTDQAYCRRCNRKFLYSDLASMVWPADAAEIVEPPRHIHLVDDGMSQQLVYRRVSPGLFFIVPFTAAWSGMSMGFLYVAPLLKGEAIPTQQALFGLPFLFGTIGLLAAIMHMAFGKLTVRLQGHDSWTFNGVGPVGRRKRFDADQIEAVRIVHSGVKLNDRAMPCIELQLRERGAIRFGSLMTDESRYFTAQYLAGRLCAPRTRR